MSARPLSPVRGGHPLGADASPTNPRYWRCSRSMCTAEARTVDRKIPHHPCPYAAGLMIPLVRADGPREDVRLVERQDYVGDELVQTDANGRPVMAAERRRDDGIDCTVYAPTAVAATEDVEAVRDGR